MQLLLLGLGSWGRRWLTTLSAHPAISERIVVDPDPVAQSLAEVHRARWFPDLATALADRHTRPMAAINAAPPAAHSALNRTLLRLGIPVLCEKPIAPDLGEAASVVAEAESLGVPFIIAENMRRQGLPRAARRIVSEGRIGPVLAIDCRFHRYYDERKPYLVAQAFPLLEDVAIHYVDLALAFAGARPERVHATAFHPGGGIFQGSPGLQLHVQFQNGIAFVFSGHFATRGRSTPWMGEWRVEGREGSLEFDEGPLRLCHGENEVRLAAEAELSVLDDFLSHLQQGTPIETSGRDYLGVQAVIAAGVRSCQERVAFAITDSFALHPVFP